MSTKTKRSMKPHLPVRSDSSKEARNSFRTSRARRQLVVDLRSMRGPLLDAPLRDTPVRENPNGDRRAATTLSVPSRDRTPELRPESLTLNDAQGEKRQEERCKRTPPPSNKGNGGSRRFVPWDRKC